MGVEQFGSPESPNGASAESDRTGWAGVVEETPQRKRDEIQARGNATLATVCNSLFTPTLADPAQNDVDPSATREHAAEMVDDSRAHGSSVLGNPVAMDLMTIQACMRKHSAARRARLAAALTIALIIGALVTEIVHVAGYR